VFKTTNFYILFIFFFYININSFFSSLFLFFSFL